MKSGEGGDCRSSSVAGLAVLMLLHGVERESWEKYASYASVG